MKRIVIDLSAESCAKAISELELYQREIKPKLEEVCRRLAEIGAKEAGAHLGGDLHGNNDATILPIEKISNGYKIVMQGEDVYFVEFGTGSEVAPHFDTTVPVGWGTYSAEHQQVLWKLGFWWYGGERLEGTPAYMPMYYASKAIRENVKQVYNEVFGI